MLASIPSFNVNAKKMIDSLPAKPNLRPAEVAKFLDVSPQTVYQMIIQGVIPALKTSPARGGHYRIPRDKLIAALESLTTEPEF
jgi:excisionase family DNA binding protein